MSQAHFSIFTHRSITVRLDPAQYAWCYLIHFSRPIGNPEKSRGLAGHYLGSTAALDHRLATHQHGNGAALMAAVSKAGIPWQVSRLWRFESCEEARAFERRLKKRGHNPQQCAICQHKPLDPYTFLRQGHRRLAQPIGKRRPMSAARSPRFVRWTGRKQHPGHIGYYDERRGEIVYKPESEAR